VGTSVEIGCLVGVSSMIGVCSTGVGSGKMGVSGGVFFSSFRRKASRFFSSVRKKTLIVVRNDLLGLQSAAATGVCSQTGQDEGRLDWPVLMVRDETMQASADTHKFRKSPVRSTEVGRR